MSKAIGLLILLVGGFVFLVMICGCGKCTEPPKDEDLAVDNDTKELLLRKRDKSLYDDDDLEVQEEHENYMFEHGC